MKLAGSDIANQAAYIAAPDYTEQQETANGTKAEEAADSHHAADNPTYANASHSHNAAKLNPKYEEVLNRIKAMDMTNLTPMEAFFALNEMQEKLKS